MKPGWKRPKVPRRAPPWKFYVYVLLDGEGDIFYIGKGSGMRLSNQRCTRRCEGMEVARFKKEHDALEFEYALIQEIRPRLNGVYYSPGRPVGLEKSKLFEVGKDGALLITENIPAGTKMTRTDARKLAREILSIKRC